MANEDVYSISSDACADKMPMCYAKVALGLTREIARGLAPFLVLEENSRI